MIKLKKKTWIYGLIIGISLSLLACEIDYYSTSTFVYINTTRYRIVFNHHKKPNYILLTLFPGGTHTSEDTDFFFTNKEGTPPFEHPTPFFDEGIVLIYDNVKCDTLLAGTRSDPLNKIGTYEGEGIIGTRNFQYKDADDVDGYTFTYTFTEKDYLKAEDCK